MRVPEISLVNELQAQNKHDLYRYYKYKRKYQQTQYPTACTVSFIVVPSVRAWRFSYTSSSSQSEKRKVLSIKATSSYFI